MAQQKPTVQPSIDNLPNDSEVAQYWNLLSLEPLQRDKLPKWPQLGSTRATNGLITS